MQKPITYAGLSCNSDKLVDLYSELTNSFKSYLLVVFFVVFSSLNLRAQFNDTSAGCLASNELISSVNIAIFADDLSDACYPLVVTINGRRFDISGPSQRSFTITCPPCNISYSVRGSDGSGCNKSGTIDANNGYASLELIGNSGGRDELNFLDFDVTAVKGSIQKPNPVNTITYSGDLCGGQSMTLTANNVSGFSTPGGTRFLWQYSYDNVSYSTIQSSSQTINFTLPTNTNAPSDIYFRANTYIEYSCSTTVWGSVNGNVTPGIRFYPPPPSINSVVANKPICPGGEGSIKIIHGSDAPIGTSFIYTITQYVAALDGEGCSGLVYPGSTSLNCGTIASLGVYVNSYCGLGEPGSFCSGFIGNFTYTLASNSEVDRTVIIDSNLAVNRTGGANELKLFPGIYKVEIESSAGRAAGVSCIQTYFLEIPPALPTPIIANPSTSLPLCVGGNDGTATFTIPLRADFNVSYDVEYTLNKAGSSYGTSYLNQSTNLGAGNTLTLTGLSAGSDYELKVKDFCQSDVMTKTFTVDPSTVSLTQNSITRNNPTCFENNAGNGSIVITMSPNFSNVTYRYSLNGSAAVEGGNTSTFNNLTPANHNLVVTTSNNCAQFETSVLLSSPPAFTVSGVASTTNPTCSNSSDGRISLPSLTKSSGTVKYSYELINNATLQTVSTQNNLTSSSYQIPSDLAAGTYRLTVNDQCLNNGIVYTVNNLTIANPVPISITSVADISMPCYDEQATRTFTVLNGTPTCWVNVSKNGISLPGYPKVNEPRGGSTVLSNLAVDKVNDYTISVAENCSVAGVTDVIDTETFSITSTADFPLVVTTSIPLHPNNLNLTCPESNDGRISVLVSGGVRSGADADAYHVYLLSASDVVLVDNDGGTATTSSNTFGIVAPGVGVAGSVRFDISGLAAGTYHVMVRDKNTMASTSPVYCEKRVNNITLTAPLPLTISNPNFANDLDNEVLFGGDVYVSCKDDANITYRTTITGGNAPYQVNLLRNSTNNFPVGMTALQSEVVSSSGGVASFENLGAGWYKVLVSDAQNCAHNEIVFEIKEAMSLPEVASVQRRAYAHGFNTICYGDATGAITINATGGLAQGDYTYVLSASDGSADRVVSKTISDPDHTFENLPALTGTGDAIVYSVALRDALGCQWTNTNGVSIDYELQPPAPVTYNWKILTPTQDGYEILCRGDAATILVQSNGGKFPHNVSLGGTTLVLSDATDSVLFDLTAGNYVLNIVDDSENGGCSAGEAIELTEPGSVVSLSIDNLIAPVCIGGTDGRVEVSGSNGSPSGVAGEAYTFLIRTTGASTFDTDTLRGTAVTFLRPANGYAGQSYDVLVLDQYGCTAEQAVVLPANATPLTLSATSLIAPSCYGATNGSISLTASNADLINGTDLIFRLSGGHLGNTISSVQVSSLTHTFNNLSGTDINNYSPYRAWVEDVHACADSADQYLPTLVLTSPSEVNINLVESIRPTCYNGADGSLLVSITGGVGPYQYSSDNITYTTVSSSNVIGTTELLAGDYTYYIRDAQYDPNQPTCQRQAVFTVNHGRQLQLNGELENVSCKGGTDGSIDLTVTVANRNANEVQDNSRLSYSWSNTNLSSLPISSAEDLNNLRRGTYTLVARYDADSTFCENSRSFSILEPESTFRISEVRTYTSSCGGGADGRALVSIAGGWSNTLNEYSLDGASWQPVASNSFILNNLSPGVHQVRVRQHGTCESVETFTIEAASLPLSIVSSINPQCPQASDGSLLVSSSDGDVEYSLDGINYQTSTVFSGLPASSYTIRARRISNPLCQSTSIVVNLIDPVDCGNGVLMLNAGSVTAATCAASVDGSAQVLASGGVPPYRYYWDGSNVAGTALQSLSGGAHSVTVKDAVDATATLAIVVPLQTPLSATVISSPASCADSCDGSINLLVSGGSGNYTYQWSDNQTTADRMNLCAGSYTVTISDAASALCTLETSAVLSSQPPLVMTAASITAPACAGGSDGSINVVATGGSGNYSYNWSNGNTGTALSAAAGDYTITLTDQVLGCSTTATFTIPEGSSVGVTTAVNMPSCVDGGDGSIQLSTTSLITPLVQWSTGQIGLQATSLSAGTYSYTLTDAMGCVQSASVVVSDPIALQITSTQNNLSCAGQCSGSIALSITGGSAPYQVLWSTGLRSSSLQNLCAGTYSYQVRDNKGCVQTGSVTIQSPAALTIVTTPTHPSCYRSSDGSVLASVTGGSGAYTYSWTRLTSTTVLSSTQALSNVNAGAYRIQVQDERGCQRSATVTLLDPLPMSLVNDKQTMPSCNGLSDGGIEVITSGGTAPYSYSWQDGVSTSMRSNLAAGSYRVEVMDAKGCRLEKTYTLTAPAALSLINVLSSDPNCFGDSNGSISLSASGGSAPYNYSWSDGSTTSSLSNLLSGSYSVVITDSKQCKLSRTFTLTAPTQLTISGIDPEYVICTGSKAVISPAGNWASYSWSGPQNFRSTVNRIETGVGGAYQLTTTDTRGCEASRSFSVTVSASALLADFLRISEALVYNPIVLVDISVPLPDKITWLLPEDGDILVNQQEGSMLELVFTRAGAYEVGLKAELGQCSAELYKVIVIETGNGRTESVEEAEQERLAIPLQTLIYPNPAKDELQLNVQAPEREQVMVSLVSALDGTVLKTETYEGQLDYLQRWGIELVKPGTYYILTQQKNKITARKIVVVK